MCDVLPGSSACCTQTSTRQPWLDTPRWWWWWWWWQLSHGLQAGRPCAGKLSLRGPPPVLYVRRPACVSRWARAVSPFFLSVCLSVLLLFTVPAGPFRPFSAFTTHVLALPVVLPVPGLKPMVLSSVGPPGISSPLSLSLSWGIVKMRGNDALVWHSLIWTGILTPVKICQERSICWVCHMLRAANVRNRPGKRCYYFYYTGRLWLCDGWNHELEKNLILPGQLFTYCYRISVSFC